jgi:ABC-type transport system involved in multi-copper enzyme maturation permease subunit
MSATTQTGQQGGSPAAVRTDLVHMGRQDFISVVLRLTGMELYKLRRRTLSKVLAIISIASVVVVFLLAALIIDITINNAATQGAVRPALEILPLSMYLALQVALILGQVLLVILVGVIVGGEYGVGTIRLMFTRGPSRTQFLIGKIGAAVSCIVLGVLVITVLGIVLGILLGFLFKLPSTYDFFNAAWVGHAILYLLIIMLSLFVDSMLALFLATVGRSTAAGIAGALVWILLGEPVLGAICSIVATTTNGTTSAFFRAVPDYFIGNSVTALQQNQNLAVFGSDFAQFLARGNTTMLSDAHALLVLVGYLIIFIGLAWWVNERRDVTN